MSNERSRPVVILLSATIVLLMGQIAWQTVQVRSLRAELRYKEQHYEERVGQLATERLRGRRDDVVRTAQWLHEYYASADGLQRPDGLWNSIEKHPDFEGIAAWRLTLRHASFSGPPSRNSEETGLFATFAFLLDLPARRRSGVVPSSLASIGVIYCLGGQTPSLSFAVNLRPIFVRSLC